MKDSISLAVIDTLHRVISDSITIEALKNVEDFYNSAFSNFAVIVSILAIFLVAFTAIAVTINFKSASKLGKELKEELEKIRSFEKEIKSLRSESEKLSIIIEKQKDDIKNIEHKQSEYGL